MKLVCTPKFELMLKYLTHSSHLLALSPVCMLCCLSRYNFWLKDIPLFTLIRYVSSMYPVVTLKTLRTSKNTSCVTHNCRVFSSMDHLMNLERSRWCKKCTTFITFATFLPNKNSLMNSKFWSHYKLFCTVITLIWFVSSVGLRWTWRVE